MNVEAGAFTRIYDPSIGEAQRWYINDHTFVRDAAGMWHLFGITHLEPAAPKDETLLAHATAPSLHGPWTKRPPVLAVDAALEESVLWALHEIMHDGQYWMFVRGGGPTPQTFRIQLATSNDCVSFVRTTEHPLIVDSFEARDPMVINIDCRWVMYYTATVTPDGDHFVVVAAESDDLRHWRGRRIVYTDGRYDRAAYRRTRVLESDDPFAFSIDRQVGTIDAHAAEVIVDEDGRTWVSHCGWGQGGVYLAPLEWRE